MFAKNRKIISLLLLLVITISFTPPAFTKPISKNMEPVTKLNTEKILYAPMYGTTTYLIEKTGEINHTWSSNYLPGESVYLLEDGSILYTNKLSLQGGGAGGGLQKIDYEGDITWEFTYYTDDYLSHHDIEPLPNGNVLMIAWGDKTVAEAINAGRDPDKIMNNEINPLHIIEVKQTGPTTGEIVWEWHAWDHLIQDYDPSKENYGTVGDHPELIDINFGSSNKDWLHTNSIDYNEDFDQILLSVRNFGEIWIIDHSTTTEEAAGHSGGNSGKGGDLLYRWGNPLAYRAGNDNDQRFYNQHDARWIKPSCPGEGNILVFNNGEMVPDCHSSVEEIAPPVDDEGNYHLEAGSAFGPEDHLWIYETDFSLLVGGGAQRIENGNTLICHSAEGIFFEVTKEKEIVWEYENPYPTQFTNNVFKLVYYNDFKKPNNPPNKPHSPHPSTGSTDVNINQLLEWSCSDPDDDDLTYDVYFEADDSTPDNLVSNNQTNKDFKPLDMGISTKYYWQILAWDEKGELAVGPIWHFTTSEGLNIPPSAYIDSIIPNPAFEGEIVYFIGHGEDIDGNIIDYQWQSNIDGNISDKALFNISELSPGIHNITFKVKDNNDTWSDSVNKNLIIIKEGNHPPDPPMISGENNGKVGDIYEYLFSTVDPDGDAVYYYIEWGDDIINDWDGPYQSDEIITRTHTWDEHKIYTIKAKARDIYGMESNWSTFNVEMSKTKTYNNPWFQRLFERFPLLEKLINTLIGLIQT